VNQAAIVENKRLGPILATLPRSQRNSTCPDRPRRHPDAARKNHMFKGRIDPLITRAARLRNAEASRAALFTTENSTPNSQKGGYRAPYRVTFKLAQNRDFSNWRRHLLLLREHSMLVPEIGART